MSICTCRQTSTVQLAVRVHGIGPGSDAGGCSVTHGGVSVCPQSVFPSPVDQCCYLGFGGCGAKAICVCRN